MNLENFSEVLVPSEIQKTVVLCTTQAYDVFVTLCMAILPRVG